jgi:signal transduction histidine kinase/ActR/RegA family two-component response regulator
MGRAHDEHPEFDRKLAALQQRVDQLYQRACAGSTQPAEERPGRADSSLPGAMPPYAPERQDLDLLQYVPAGVAQLDTNYRLVLANATARRYFALLTPATVGERISALGGTPIEELVIPRTGGLPHEVVLDGLLRRVFVVWPRTLPETEAGGWMLLIQDVTAEHHMQRQRAQQERLAAMEQLVVGLANEFSTLLYCMIGYTELLPTQVTDSKTLPDHLSPIIRWGYRGVEMTRHLLDFSGQSRARFRPVDLLLMLNQLIPLLQDSLPASIRVVLDSAPGAYLINADAALMRQLLTNLTVNARDAMPDGGVLCFCLSHLRLCPDDSRPCPNMGDGEWVTLTVADTGRGLQPQVQERIFDPFFTTQTGVYAGLGLAQAYGIVKQHGGYMAVMSQPQHGTVFTLYLPSQAVSEAATGGGAVPEAVPRGQGQTLLLVDYDSLRREALRLTLQYLGYQVLTAASSREALALCDYHGDTIALVLTALAPAAQGGLALVRALRQRHPNVKVIALMGELHWPARHDLLAQGVITCLRQPPDLPLLAQAVSQSIGSCYGDHVG